LNVKSLTRHGCDECVAEASIFSFFSLRFSWQATCSAEGMLDRLTHSLECYMDVLAARQKVVASNIANTDTPGYKTRDLNFQAEFQSALDGGVPQAAEVSGLPVKNDGNNVNLDREARLLAENAMRFNFASTLMRQQIRIVKEAIQEGKNS